MTDSVSSRCIQGLDTIEHYGSYLIKSYKALLYAHGQPNITGRAHVSP